MHNLARERRNSRIVLTIAIISFCIVLASVVPSPFVIERPGPVVDTLGEITIEGESGPVIELDGVETFPTSGQLNLLSVTFIGNPDSPTNWLRLIGPLLDPQQDIVPISEVFPSGVTAEQRETFNVAMMDSSQTLAAVAALHELGEEPPATLHVAAVGEDGAAQGKLEVGDEILSVNGSTPRSPEELRGLVDAVAPGEAAQIMVDRDDQQLTVEVVPEESGEDGKLMLGIALSSTYDLPFDLNMSVDNIGGPSAGMIFALAIYDQLTEEDLTGGLSISGTGTVDDSGAIGEIGGLPQKLWGAKNAGSDLFLMPLANCGDLPDRLPADLPIAPVATIDEALAAIAAVTSGAEPAGVERCTAP